LEERFLSESQTFATILADPDWAYNNYGAAKHGAARAHYAGSTVDFISQIPVRKWARKDSTLLLWATCPKLDQAIDVMRAWGFSLVTSFPWVKTVPSKAELAKGIGFWIYGSAELLLVCRQGKTPAPKYKKGEKPDGLLVGEKGECVFYARRGAHSRKPLSLIEWIESYLPGPLLELYARTTRPGWTSWGEDTGYWLDENGVHKIEKKGKPCPPPKNPPPPPPKKRPPPPPKRS
jgi:N6-adenosine-specific RNA methylase IME4